tara:strand:+ start:275 stop:766 length:492 start_codon:yes stop_codon:yes gene_type:complete
LSEAKPTIEHPNPAAEQLEKYLEQLDSWTTESNSNYASFHGEYIEAANMSMSELQNLTQADIFDYAYLLQGYATYLQDEFNRHQIIVDWCNNQIEILVQKYRNEFGQYQKHEQRRYQLIAENIFVAKVNNMLQVADSRLTSLNGKIWELKTKSNILLEKGKRL